MDIFDKEILEKIGKKLLLKKETISVAESVTSGLMQLAMSGIPNATSFYQGGITTYNLGQKYKHLGVDPIHGEETNCVSQEVALQMALGASTLFQSHWGIGISGYATPAPESDHKLFAFYSIIFKGQIIGYGKLISNETDPLDVQKFYASSILEKLETLL